MTCFRGPPVIAGVPAGVGRPPLNGVAPAGAGRPPVNEGTTGAARSSETALLIAMQAQMRAMSRAINRLVHEGTAAAAATARPSEAGEALWEHRVTHRLAWSARGVLADDEALWAPRRPLAHMLEDAAKVLQPRAAS
jgi:hypothetical protein